MTLTLAKMNQYFAVVTVSLFFVIPTTASDATVSPGMGVTEAKAILESRGFEVDDKFHLSISPGDKRIGMEFSKLDENSTLVILYEISTGKITLLKIYIHPNNPTTKGQDVVRSLTEIVIHENQELSFRFKPKRG